MSQESSHELDAAGIHDPLLREAYRHCEHLLLRRHPAAHPTVRELLPVAKRPYWDAVMAICGHADQLADAPDRLLAERRRAYDAFLATLRRVLDDGPEAGGPQAGEPHGGEQSAGSPAGDVRSGFLVCVAVGDFTRTWRIPDESVRLASGALRDDMDVSEYRTAADLDRHVHAISCVPALWVATLLGADEDVPGAEDAVREAVVALAYGTQALDNLADLAEDLRLGKLYLPLDDLTRCGLTRADVEHAVATGRSTEAMDRVVSLQLDRIRGHLARGEDWARVVHPTGREFVRAMLAQARNAVRDLEYRICPDRTAAVRHSVPPGQRRQRLPGER